MVVQSLARRVVEFPGFRKGVVPCPTRATKLNRQSLRLLFGRIEANSGRVEHVLDIAAFCLKSKRRLISVVGQFELETDPLPLYPRPEGRGFTA